MTKQITWEIFEKTGDLQTYLLLKKDEKLKDSSILDENNESEAITLDS